MSKKNRLPLPPSGQHSLVGRRGKGKAPPERQTLAERAQLLTHTMKQSLRAGCTSTAPILLLYQQHGTESLMHLGSDQDTFYDLFEWTRSTIAAYREANQGFTPNRIELCCATVFRAQGHLLRPNPHVLCILTWVDDMEEGQLLELIEVRPEPNGRGGLSSQSFHNPAPVDSRFVFELLRRLMPGDVLARAAEEAARPQLGTDRTQGSRRELERRFRKVVLPHHPLARPAA